MNVAQILQALKTLPQTQRDIQSIARTGESAQSPQVQQMLAQAQLQAVSYAALSLLFQAVMTAGTVYVAYKVYKRGS